MACPMLFTGPITDQANAAPSPPAPHTPSKGNKRYREPWWVSSRSLMAVQTCRRASIKPWVTVECDDDYRDGPTFTDDCSSLTKQDFMVAKYTVSLEQLSPDTGDRLVAVYAEGDHLCQYHRYAVGDKSIGG